MKNWFKVTSDTWSVNGCLKITAQLLLLALVLWVAHYFHFREFGFYEDDYAQISPPLGWNQADLFNYLKWVLTWPQGRPLQYFFTGILSFISGKLGGLSSAYLIGLIIQTTNAILFYFLLRRHYLEKIAIIGAVIFGLFPPDTTHIFLTHAFSIHLSLTFLLSASLLYHSRHRFLSYVLGLATLLTYEGTFMVVLFIPMLGLQWERDKLKEMARHLIIWLGIILFVLLVRITLGEERVLQAGSSIANIIMILFQVLQSLVIGPGTSLWMFVYGPGYMLINWQREFFSVFIFSLPFFAWLIGCSNSFIKPAKGISENTPVVNPEEIDYKNNPSLNSTQISRWIITSLAMLSISYGVSFLHFPPTAKFGRLTSVHAAGVLGGSLLMACICAVGYSYAKKYKSGILAIVLLSTYLSLLLVYRYSIQLDFKQAWQNQQTFWVNVTAGVPDMEDEMVIFVLDRDLPTTRYIKSNSWADPFVLNQILKFPDAWQSPPRVFVVQSDWTETVVRKNENAEWEYFIPLWNPHWEMLPEEGLVLLDMQNGMLVRRLEDTLTIDGFDLNLKPPGQISLSFLEKGPLYAYLIESSIVGP